MGRLRDQIWWDNVEELSGGKWRCNDCKVEYSGSASRIRTHLFGGGSGIELCEGDEASNRRTHLKRARLSSRPSSSSNPKLMTATDNDDVNVGSRGVIMSNNANFDGVNLSQERDVAVENRSVSVQVTDPCLHAPSSSARLNVVERRDTSTDPSLPSSSRDPNLMARRDADLYVTDQKSSEDWSKELEAKGYPFQQHSCLRNEIQRLCSKICEGSEWAKGLVNKADKIHQYVADSHWCDYMDNKTFKEERVQRKKAHNCSFPLSFSYVAGRWPQKLDILSRTLYTFEGG